MNILCAAPKVWANVSIILLFSTYNSFQNQSLFPFMQMIAYI